MTTTVAIPEAVGRLLAELSAAIDWRRMPPKSVIEASFGDATINVWIDRRGRRWVRWRKDGSKSLTEYIEINL